MTLYSDAVLNAANNTIESTITAGGTIQPTLEIRGGTAPASCAATDSGTTLLASITLPMDWLTAASTGSSSKVGTWSAVAIDNGVPTFYRIKQGSTCHQQDPIVIAPAAIAATGGMSVSHSPLSTGGTFTVASYTQQMLGQ